MTKSRDLANAATALNAVTATEIGYVDGVTSAIQTQLNAKQAVVSGVNDTEIGYLDGVTSAIQTQLDAKTAKSTLSTTGDIYYASSANTPARLGIGSTGNVLTVASGIPSWAAPAAGGSTFVGCSLYKSANQSISSSVQTAITFDTELEDTDGFHSTSSNTPRITIPAGKAGFYLITGQVNFASNATGLRNCELRKNGTAFTTLFIMPAVSGDWTGSSYSQIQELAVADYIELFAYQTSGGSLNINGGNTYGATFQVQYLGA